MDHATISELAARQHGVVAFDQFVEAGLSKDHVKHFVAEGFLERLHLGVFKVRGAPSTYEQRLVAACVAIGPEAAASHRAAATLHQLLSYRDPPIEVTTTRLRSPELEDVVVHRLADLSERWITVVDGVRVTTVARTLVDLGAVASLQTVEAALDRASGRKMVTYRGARDALRAVARRGRHGVGKIRQLLDARMGEALPTGVLEARMGTLLRGAGLPAAVAEFVVTDEHGGFIAVVDFAIVEWCVAIEGDGYETHSTPRALDDRNARDALLIRAGWFPVHFSWAEVDRRSPHVVERIREALRHQSRFSARSEGPCVSQRAENGGGVPRRG